MIADRTERRRRAGKAEPIRTPSEQPLCPPTAHLSNPIPLLYLTLACWLATQLIPASTGWRKVRPNADRDVIAHCDIQHAFSLPRCWCGCEGFSVETPSLFGFFWLFLSSSQCLHASPSPQTHSRLLAPVQLVAHAALTFGIRWMHTVVWCNSRFGCDSAAETLLLSGSLPKSHRTQRSCNYSPSTRAPVPVKCQRDR